MLFSIIGIDFTKSPVETRQLFSFQEDEITHALYNLNTKLKTESAVILSTCNRVEIYSDCLDYEALILWWSHFKHQDSKTLLKQTYFKTSHVALKHLIEVGSGINSMVIGENQILGQVKKAYQISLATKMIRNSFYQCFNQAFQMIKKIKKFTQLSKHQISVASIAVNNALELDPHQKLRYLIIGAGQTAELTLRYLHQKRQNNVILTNRTNSKGLQLSQKYGVSYIEFEKLSDIIPHSDIIITSTSSSTPILKPSYFLEKKNTYPQWHIFDLAVPLDTHSELISQNNIHLTKVDDLEKVSQRNCKHRQLQIKQALTCISYDLELFNEKVRQKSSHHKVVDYINSCNEAKEVLIHKALMQIQQGNDSEDVIRQLAYKLTKKLTHMPIKLIKSENKMT